MSYSSSSTDDTDTEDERRSKKKKKHSKKSKSRKREKEKKQKKSKKRKRKLSTTTESSSESEEEWIVKGQTETASNKKSNPLREDSQPTIKDNFSKPEDIDNTDWADFTSAIPTYSNDLKKEKRQQSKDWHKVRSASKPGQHSRELNPYWKDGGDGLPSRSPLPDPDSKILRGAVPTGALPGDSGLHWLKKSYQRAKEQAAEGGRSLEDIAAERWGSLSNIHAMLEEAEKNASTSDTRIVGSHSRQRQDRKDRRRSNVSSFKRPKRDSSDDEDKSHHESKFCGHSDRNSLASFSRSSSQRQPTWMKRSVTPALVPKPESNTNLVCQAQASSSNASPLPDHSLSADSEQPTEIPRILTEQEMNVLSARILKAEMLGNTALTAELKAKHASAEYERNEFIKRGGDPQMREKSKKVVTKVIMGTENRERHRREKMSETHQDGQRVRYFPDDDKQSLQNMFQKEKMSTAEDENALFSRLAGKGMKFKPTDDYDLDDIFADKASSSKKVEKEKEREIQKVINEEKFYKKVVEDCSWCFDGHKLEKNIVISMGKKAFLCVPPFQSLSEGHCLIVPMYHVSSSTDLDEDVWEEIKEFRHALVRMFKEKDEDVIIFEMVTSLKQHPHMYLECVPIPKETGELAPIYFKKAIQECESEWSQNKKLVDLRGRDVRKGVPKGLPYFFVDFGNDSGFAHIIEDERSFPRNFAHEIIGGMMELDHSVWRKKKYDTFKEKRDKLMNFLKAWGPYDFTRDT